MRTQLDSLLSQFEARRASVPRAAYVAKPDLDAQIEGRPPLVDDLINGPCACAAEVNHFAEARQWSARRKELRCTPAPRQVLLLVIRNAEVNRHTGCRVVDFFGRWVGLVVHDSTFDQRPQVLKPRAAVAGAPVAASTLAAEA